MSTYQDIYHDLPSRVYEVWQRTKKIQEEEIEDRSVTAMLMAAAAGLAMPLENLKDIGVGNGKKWKDHPAFSNVDPKEYKAALKRCDTFFLQPINSCKGLSDAVLMHCQELGGIKDAANCAQGDASLDIAKHDVRFGLKILRNALAHNNILDIPDSQNRIEKLAFFSRSNWCSSCDRLDGWHVLLIPIQSFEVFLTAWFDLLKSPGSYVAAATVAAGVRFGGNS